MPETFRFRNYSQGGCNSKIFGVFTPKIGEGEPILRSIFFKWVVQPPTRHLCLSCVWVFFVFGFDGLFIGSKIDIARYCQTRIEKIWCGWALMGIYIWYPYTTKAPNTSECMTGCLGDEHGMIGMWIEWWSNLVNDLAARSCAGVRPTIGISWNQVNIYFSGFLILFPIGSMGLVYFPTWMVDFYGAYGFEI